MYWPIRHQILVPLIASQVIAIMVITITTATLAARRGERQIIDRLNGVIDTLGHANFPFTASVLAQMQGLSSAHFIAQGDDARLISSSLHNVHELPPALRSIPSATRLDSLGNSSRVVVEGTSYFVARLTSRSRPLGQSLLVLYPESDWRQAQWEAVIPVLMLGVGSLVILSLVTSWIAHRFSVRIRRVERQVAKIADGDFQELVLGREHDEVQDLSRSINSMCGQLREMRRTIQQSERTRLLGQFAAGMAHQLRNSLTGARMSVQLYAKRYPPPDGDQSLDVALRQLTITEEQVKGLLSLGRVEIRPPEVCDLKHLFAEVILLVEHSCRHAKVGISQYHDEAFSILADTAGLRAATLNLVLNAIEAAGRGGKVSIEAHSSGNEVAIEVVDNGPGPPSELEDSLCEAFVSGKPEGVGLGLALANQVATEHGGRLSWCRKGTETRFRLTLPMIIATPKGAA